MMFTRNFKINNGNMVKVVVTNTMITIKVLDFQTNEVILTNPFVMTEISYWDMKDFVYQLTDIIQAKEIMDYIESKSGISKRLFKNR